MITEEEFVSHTKKELESMHHFIYTHCVTYGCDRGSIRIKYINGGGIGSGLIIKCKHCKVKKDITDYESW